MMLTWQLTWKLMSALVWQWCSNNHCLHTLKITVCTFRRIASVSSVGRLLLGSKRTGFVVSVMMGCLSGLRVIVWVWQLIV